MFYFTCDRSLSKNQSMDGDAPSASGELSAVLIELGTHTRHALPATLSCTEIAETRPARSIDSMRRPVRPAGGHQRLQNVVFHGVNFRSCNRVSHTKLTA